ncbi:MAG TPA: 5'/3'-nucleotidase SurE [Anaerolineales bacterium]|nr:5'/3'-nucleotidase SurE [Anaerolineales bacterium]
MHILVTNDDGVTAPGLAALANALRESGLGKVTVLAPNRNWSASGHVKTLHSPLRVRPAKLADGSDALASDGAPSDCVALALLGVVKEKIDLVVSGINPFPNLGHDVTYSGTVTAAMEAVIGHVPGIAVSLDTPRYADYSPAARIAARVAREVIARGLPPHTLLNVNVPGLPENEIKGVRITRQGLSVYLDELDERVDPRGVPYYWIGGEAPTGEPEEGTDFAALADGYVSVTPLQLDLTAHTQIGSLRNWNL